ncbi:Dihydrofolate reductase [Orchesella cincta]|uniref:dihydrofolate reductase n=1 Tax=Orchesella cincta TaxID=48709 RepID=A0A1D2N8I7_ORCCI|nr:Dihydrofolate reductase [Orchesella cincta]
MLASSSIAGILRQVCNQAATMAPLQLNLIAACDAKMGIGLKNDLPWRLRNEMAYFNRMTTGSSKNPGSTSGESKKNVVVMGRKTWDSIPLKFRPLKNRINEVNQSDVVWTTSWDETIRKLEELEAKGEIGKIWVTGGSFVYKLALESVHCNRIYLTRLQKDYGCDVFFPDFDTNTFQQVTDPEVPEEEQDEGGIKYNFYVYENSTRREQNGA